jgi:hypothetical protein
MRDQVRQIINNRILEMTMEIKRDGSQPSGKGPAG